MTETQKFFVECVKAGIKDTKITILPQNIDYKKLYNLCIAHAVSVIVYYALSGVRASLPPAFCNALQSSVETHILRDAQSDADDKIVVEAFEKAGVKFMPLKGYNLKHLYPKAGMRFASDCDILIDKKEIKKVRKTVADIGLTVKRHDEHHDIVYFDATKSVYELHKMLFVGRLGKYFGVGFEKAKLKDGYKYFYELSPEDFYMTLIAHSAYHFVEGGGVGIRHLTDIYIFRKHFALDEDYLAREFDKCGLREFQLRFEKLARCFFEEEETDEFTAKLADYVLSSTVLANEDKKGAAEISAHDSKGKAFFKTVFPPVRNMKFTYPILNKAIILLPIFYVVRWFRVIFKTPERFSRLKDINAVSPEEIKEVKEIRDGLGINGL